MSKAMKRVLCSVPIFVVAFSLATFPLAAQMPQAKNELKIVFIAYENPDQLLEDVRPVVAYLEGRLRMKVKPFVATDYAAVVEALRNNSADIGFMGPLQYVMAHDQAGATPILGELYNGKATYTARIFVRKDSGIQSLAELRGKTIAFVDPLSSSGYVYPLEIFRAAGLVKNKDEAEKFFRKIYFAGGDEQAIRAVFNKFVNAAGIGQYAYSLLRPDERDALRFIAESAPIPSHCIVARKGLDAQTIAAVQAALLALNQGSQRALLKHLYNVDGYVKVTPADYAGVEQVAQAYGFLKSR